MARHIDIRQDEEPALAEACSVLADGYPVAIPTETVYGLAADATNPVAIARIYETKGRPSFNPLICHMADLEMAEEYAIFDPLSRRLAEAFWPGPLTLILPLRPGSHIHPLATAGLDTVGIRVPEGFSGRLIRRYGKPLGGPSANTSGKISPTSARHVEDDLGDRLRLIIDGGPTRVGVESTILKVEDDRIRLLRPGGLTADMVREATGIEVERTASGSATIEAPGMLASHYAPGAAVRLNATEIHPGEVLIRLAGATVTGEEHAVLVLDLSPGGDLAEAASNLFDYLKIADATGTRSIAITAIPDHGAGEAINDRLARAAAPRS